MPHLFRPVVQPAILAALLAVFPAVGCSGDDSSATPTVTVTVTAPASAAAATTQTRPRTVLTDKGVGLKTTRTFVVHGDWDLAYSYDCGGEEDRFSVSQIGGEEELFVDEISTGRNGTTHLHHGPGEMALEISGVKNVCRWTIKVIQR